jgi:hypothetical protein
MQRMLIVKQFAGTRKRKSQGCFNDVSSNQTSEGKNRVHQRLAILSFFGFKFPSNVPTDDGAIRQEKLNSLWQEFCEIVEQTDKRWQADVTMARVLVLVLVLRPAKTWRVGGAKGANPNLVANRARLH